MKLLRVVNLVLASALLLPAAGWAAKLQEPQVDYSADSVIEAEQATIKPASTMPRARSDRRWAAGRAWSPSSVATRR